jgi:hypothetical protein
MQGLLGKPGIARNLAVPQELVDLVQGQRAARDESQTCVDALNKLDIELLFGAFG